MRTGQTALGNTRPAQSDLPAAGKTERSNPHAGHRKRMRARLRAHPETLEAHELLEILLYQSIPRRNTNETAHALLHRFLTLDGVLSATPEELMEIENIGPSSVSAIQLCGALVRRIILERGEERSSFRTIGQIGEYLVRRYAGARAEVVSVLFFDSAMHLLLLEELPEGTLSSCDPLPKVLCRRAVLHHATALVLAHNHPDGSLQPSPEDLLFTQQLEQSLRSVDVRLIEHLIIAGDRYQPILRKEQDPLG